MACSIVCNRSWRLPGNSKLVWHPARLIKEGGCVVLSMHTLHLKYPLVLFGSEGSALTLPLSPLSPRIIMLCHCSSTMTKDQFLVILYGTKWPSCVDVPLTHSFIQVKSTHLLWIPRWWVAMAAIAIQRWRQS